MTDKTRIKIAAVVTALFLVGISAVGLAARTDQPQTAAASSAPALTAVQTPAAVRAPGAVPATQSSADEDERYDDERDAGPEDHD
jgi:hypothetical protein